MISPEMSLQEQAEAAEKRGLAFFDRLSQSSSKKKIRTTEEEEEFYRDEGKGEDGEGASQSSLRFDTSHLRGPSIEGRQLHRYHQHSTSSPSASSSVSNRFSWLSEHRRESYGVASQSPHRPASITVTVSISLSDGRLPALSMTLSSSQTVRQMKELLCKKLSNRRMLSPSDIALVFNGRELKDAYPLADVPVPNGSLLKARCYADNRDTTPDAVRSNQHTVFQTPQSKSLASESRSTSHRVPISNLKQSPFSIASPNANEISGLSFQGTEAFGNLNMLHKPYSNEKSHVEDLSFGRLTSAQKTTTGGAVVSEEAAFYDVLEGVMPEDPSNFPFRFDNIEQQGEIADVFATEVASRCQATVSNFSLQDTSLREDRHKLMLNIDTLRAERDMWSLCSQLLAQRLLKDIQDDSNELALNDALRNISPSKPLKEVINKSIEADERIKKGRVLKDWIESCNRDQVHEPPAPRDDDSKAFPWIETLLRMKKNCANHNSLKSKSTGVRSIHPDAQVGPNGEMMRLDGDDHTDQETLLKVIWQHIRCGQLVEAQKLSHQHKVHWLTAALMGVAEEFYSYNEADGEMDDASEGDVKAAKRGNKNRPMWIQVCWKYSSTVSSQTSNRLAVPSGHEEGKVASQVAELEASIYSALSTNYSVLKESAMLQSFSDHLWARILCAHEHQLVHVSNQFRLKRLDYSRLYPGATDGVVAMERKYLHDTRQFASSFADNAQGLVENTYLSAALQGSAPAAVPILQLQVAMIQGWSALRDFILKDIRSFALNSKQSSKRGNAVDSSAEHRILRVFAHFLIWLRLSCKQCEHLVELVPDGVLHLVLESYISRLARRKQFSLVALYCRYLSRPKRIGTFINLLRIISPTSVRSEEGHIVSAASIHIGGSATLASTLSGRVGNGYMTCMALSGRNTGLRGVDDNATALEILTLAKKFFDSADIVEITNAVVELARTRGSSSSALSSTMVDFSETNRLPVSDPEHEANPLMATSTIVPGHYDEGDIPAEDAERLECLRWLCYSEDQYADAIREANAFLRSLMIESQGAKSLQVRVLLTNILPSNFITLGYEHVQLRADQEDNPAERKVMEDCWDADVGQLELWKYIDLAVYCFEGFRKEINEFYAKKADYVGEDRAVLASLSGLKHQIVRAADRCLRSTRKALVCGRAFGRSSEVDTHGFSYFEDSDSEHDLEERGGFLAIWSCSVDATVGQMVHLLATHQARASAGTEQGDMLQDESLAAQVTAECFDHLVALEGARHEVMTSEELSGHIASLFAPPAGLELVREGLEKTSRLPLSFTTSTLLEKIRDLLKSILDIRSAMQIVAYMLSKNYVDVCVQTAGVLEALNVSAMEALQWHQEGADVAVLLADEAENMQLYKALAMDDMKKVLGSVCTANTNILRLKKSFDIFQ